MKLNIVYDSVDYITNENCVVAILRNVKLGCKTFDYFCSRLRIYPNDDFEFQWVKGIARLKEGDECNLALAKKVAKKKALRCAYREMCNKIAKTIIDMEARHDDLIDILSHGLFTSDQIDTEICEMVRGNE